MGKARSCASRSEEQALNLFALWADEEDVLEQLQLRVEISRAGPRDLEK